MKVSFLTLMMLAVSLLQAQTIDKIRSNDGQPDTIQTNIYDEDPVELYEQNGDSTVYEAFHNIVKTNDPYSYLSFFPAVNLIDQRYELAEGTGIKGFLLEGVVDQRFTIIKGRDSNRHWMKLTDLAFYFGYDLRMAQDSSKPLIPSNQRIGFEWRQGLWTSYTKRRKYEEKPFKSDTRNWYEGEEELDVLYFTFQAAHYSNGQATGFFINNDTDRREHDYLSGDFSTNFFKAMLIYSRFREDLQDLNNQKRNLYSGGLGYQLDWGTNGPLFFSPEQEQSYGNHRIHAFLQWRVNYFHFWNYYRKYTSFSGKKYRLKEYMELKFRAEPSFILGDLSNYYKGVGNGFLESDYRFAVHAYAELNFLRNRSISFLFHYYYGRDYFNIRYDGIISSFQAGISINFSRVMPLRFNSRESIKRVLPDEQ